MPEVAQLLLLNFAVLMACMLLLWLLSMPLRDVSFIDTFWALGFIIVAGVSFAFTGGGTLRRELLFLLTAVWGARLGAHLFLRWRRNGPDARYVALLARAPGNVHAFTLQKVFLLQGVMLWVVSLPLQLGQLAPQPADPGPLGWLGVALAIIGIGFETIGDYQLTTFVSDATNRGKVMDRGLWRYTRHPNYFGDTCVFWGLYLIAAESWPGPLGFVGPALLTWTLVRWSGAALLERRMRRSRPGYDDYVARTSSFIPWPPKPRPNENPDNEDL